MKNQAHKMQTMNDTVESLFDHHKDLSASQVTFDPQVREMCAQNRCGNYGRSWTCPPALGALEDLQTGLARMDRFLIFDKVYEITSSMDWNGMMAAARDFQNRIRKLRRALRKDCPGLDFVVLGAGQCTLCDPCTYQDKEPCRHPEEAVYSLEAHGIDVIRAMKENGLKCHNGKNTVTYIGGVFYLSASVA